MVHLLHKKTTLTVVSLACLLLLSFFLRFYLIPSNLFFGPEQGRDFLVIKDIVVSHKLTLIGPKTDIEGVFHGPVFYYLSAIPFLLSHGNPIIVSLFLIIIHALTIIGVYFLGKEMFGKRVGILASILFTFSFGAIVYARWLSNPPLSIPIAVLFFLCLWKFLKGKKNYLLPLAILFGLLGQVEFINFIFYGILFLLLLIIYRKEFSSTNKLLLVVSAIVLLISSVGNFALFDIRHEFLITKSVLGLLVGKSGFYLSFFDAILKAINTFFAVWSYFIFPNNFIFAVCLFLLSIGFFVITQKNSKQSVITLLWIFTPLLIVIVLKHDSLEHFFIASAIAYLLVISVLIDTFFKKNRIVGIALVMGIIVSNFFFWKVNLPTNKNVVFETTQPELLYKDQIAVVNGIYNKSSNKPFEVQAYTIPYWSGQAWEYLFWYTSQKNHMVIPTNGSKTIFVIIQKDTSNALYQKEWLDKTVSKWGVKNDQFSFGILTVWKLATI